MHVDKPVYIITFESGNSSILIYNYLKNNKIKKNLKF